jgi:hypothetical protein
MNDDILTTTIGMSTPLGELIDLAMSSCSRNVNRSRNSDFTIWKSEKKKKKKHLIQSDGNGVGGSRATDPFQRNSKLLSRHAGSNPSNSTQTRPHESRRVLTQVNRSAIDRAIVKKRSPMNFLLCLAGFELATIYYPLNSQGRR